MDERGISPFPPNAVAASGPPPNVNVVRRDARAFPREVWRTLAAVGPFGLASQVAYSLIFALPSIVLIVVVIGVAVGRWTGMSPLAALETAAERNLAPSLRAPARSLEANAMARAAEPGPTISAIVSVAVALAIAGSGVRVLSRACVRASGERDDRPLWRKQLAATGVALVLAALLIAAFVLILCGESLWLAATTAWFGTPVEGPAVRVIRRVAELLAAAAILLVLYKSALGRAWSWRSAAVGAAVAAPLWFAAGAGFQLYLRGSDPGSAYGAASGALVLLAFLYVSSLIVIVGAMATATVRRRQRSRLDGPDSPSLAR
ncbi:MAG TPA: YhjD/YihY/BrkB family envelope integrity protein [Thermomicrobiales bacterium]|jgi:membrane protein|nr:YhjD/YihY/BrkB family envelope integrity protein [Thermomicrobiales bacterium]